MKKLNLLLLGILILGIFIRFYQLGQIPSGLTNDEADMGYDAYSVLLTGKDQWGQFLPVTSFRGFGDFRPVMYSYLIIPFIKLFDLNSMAVRLPSAIAGSLSILAIYYLTRKLFVNDWKLSRFTGEILPLSAAFLFAISPWSIGLSRLGVESNVAILFTLISLILLVGFKKSKINFFAGMFFLAITTYTYSAYFLFSFLLLFIYIYFYRDKLIKLKSGTILGFVFFLIIISPLLFNSLTARTRLSQVGLTTNINSIGLIQDLNDKRGYCNKDYPQAICKIVNNKPFVFTGELFKNYLSHFSPDFLYLNGTTSQFSILPKRGLEFTFEIIFLIAGLASIILSKKKAGFFILTLFLFSPIPDSLTGSGNYSRASIMLPYLLIIEGLGLSYLLARLTFIRNMFIKNLTFVFISGIIIFSIVSFFVSYTTYFKNYYSRYSQYGYGNLVSQISLNNKNYQQIYVSRNINDAKQYIYYLFYAKTDPVSFQKKVNVEYNLEDGGWVNVSRIGNVNFIPNLSSIDKKKLLDQNVLFFAHPSEFPDKIKYRSEIKDLAGTVIFREVEMKELIPYWSTNSL